MSYISIPQRNNGERILAEWFNSLRTKGLATGIWTKYTVTHTNLQAAALTNNITLFTLVAGGVIESIVVKHSTAFAGSGITDYKIGIGITGSLDKYLGDFDVDSAVADANFETVGMNEIPNVAGTTAIKIKATSVGANLSLSTAGSVDIWVKTSILP